MRLLSLRAVLLLAAALVAHAAPAPASAPSAAADTSTTLAALRDEAKALRPLFQSQLVTAFLDGAALLPSPGPRTIWFDSSRTHYYNAKAFAALPETARARHITRTLGESFYYNTRYGTPLAYARPLEILASHGFTVPGHRIVDFGYGTVGHLRLLAALGADLHGIDVDPLLTALYSEPGDQGLIAGKRRNRGRLRLHHGQWPANPQVAGEVGTGYDLFLSKNTLKRGYIHPERPADPRMLVNLGVDDTAFVRALAATVKPGGLVMIYNLSPAPSPADQPYKPWTDGRCPFPRALWEAQGFEVLEFDRDDSVPARAMGHALGWDSGPSPMNLENDLFGHYSLFRRKR